MQTSFPLVLVAMFLGTLRSTGKDSAPGSTGPEAGAKVPIDTCGAEGSPTRGWRTVRSRDGTIEIDSPFALSLDDSSANEHWSYSSTYYVGLSVWRSAGRPSSVEVDGIVEGRSSSSDDSLTVDPTLQPEHKSCWAEVAGQVAFIRIGRTNDYDHLWFVRASLPSGNDSTLNIALTTAADSVHPTLLTMLRSVRFARK